MSHQAEVVAKEKAVAEKRASAYQSVRPNVDIHEDKEGITLLADIPGVSREALDIQIDNEILSIDGRVELPLPNGAKADYAGNQTTRFQRSFCLSKELDGEQVEATLKDGVLALRIPKRQEFTPRKIEIRTA
ncbi:heat-shock protein [Candidatus Thiodiazotropha endoloripes]|uniref:Hsp20/alpha crystallin family protein n=1 Tax=Candidatus Thiodiazotropha endoloripes TaxID=1818881 RepID=UPI00083CEBFC|nr:Hsp20/alpha crystallin family protein [Candidatus Thiodiazotropha endoloripes]ODB85746.1 heat-shock protein [Candidatus Thiodiazotropha endoloripes]